MDKTPISELFENFLVSFLGLPVWLAHVLVVVTFCLLLVTVIMTLIAFLLFFGLLQSFADLLKFVFKEIVIPAGSNKILYLVAPILTVTLAVGVWAVVPVADGWVLADINIGILYIFAISSLGVYGIIIGGWASNSKYSLLGGLRSAAQMVSYEVSIGFVLVTVLLWAGSLNLSDIVRAQEGWWFVANPILFPMFVVFFISALAETNRPPFDLPEAESELVAGYQVEYGSTPYLLFMLGEYMNIVLMCAMSTVLFLGGWMPPLAILDFIPAPLWFTIKVCLMFFMFGMVKAMVPRYRYDQLMRLGWKVFLPLSLVWVALVGAIVTYTPSLPILD
jgi:NADH-quinone oxidoreductase subunit H